jgi:hypothetical protein
MEFWNTAPKVRELLKLGDLSHLGKEIGVFHDFNEYFRSTENIIKYDNMCLAYGRDRGETGTQATYAANTLEFLTKSDNCNAEYCYMFHDGEWYVNQDPPKLNPEGFMSLKRAIELEETGEAEDKDDNGD